ncbi:hypothetical protein ABPG74_002040 [Tetrahymena malaccensis]
MNRLQEFGLKCKRHKEYDILYIKVNNIQNDEDIMFCGLCPSDYKGFSQQDCALLQQICKKDSFIMNYLPFINDAKFIKQIQQIMKQNNNDSLITKIQKLYDSLQSIVADSKKKAMNLAEGLTKLSKKSQKEYCEIIKVEDIKNVLIESCNQNQKETKIRNLLQQINYDKQKNTQRLSNIVEEYEKLQTQFQQIQQSLFSDQLQNLINQNSFKSEYYELFPPNYIDLIPNLDFSLQQINQDQNNPVVNRQNNQIEFVIQNQFQQQQFYLKDSLNKMSEYFLKFKIKNTNDFILNNTTNSFQKNYQNNQNYIYFQIELFNQNNKDSIKKFTLNCNLTDLFQSQQNNFTYQLEQQYINQQNFNPAIQGYNQFEQKNQNNLQIQNTNQLPSQNSQYNQHFQDTINNNNNYENQNYQQQDNSQLHYQNQNNYQSNMQNQNFDYCNQQDFSTQNNISQNYNQNNYLNQDYNLLYQQQQQPQNFDQQYNLNQNYSQNNLQNQNLNDFNQQQQNLEYYNNQNQNSQLNYNQNYQSNFNQNNVAPYQDYQNMLYQTIQNFDSLNLAVGNVQQQPSQTLHNYQNNTQNYYAQEIPQIGNQGNNQPNMQNLAKNNTSPNYLNQKQNLADAKQHKNRFGTFQDSTQYKNDQNQLNIYSQYQKNTSLRPQTLQGNLNYEIQNGDGLISNYENIVQNGQNFNQNNDQLNQINQAQFNQNQYQIQQHQDANIQILQLPPIYQQTQNNNNQIQKEIEILAYIQISEGIFQASCIENKNQVFSLDPNKKKELEDCENLYLKITFDGIQQLMLLQANELRDPQKI